MRPLIVSRTTSPLRTINYNDYLVAHRIDRAYYSNRGRDRWPLIAACAACINPLLTPTNTVLELGPGVMPLVKGCTHTMDNVPRGGIRPTYLWDATRLPWPIKSRAYDIFLAFQVIEHLGDHKERIFKEIKRVSRCGVISLPFKWPGHTSHSGIDDVAIRRWVGRSPDTRVIVNLGDAQERVICVYKHW